MPEEIEKRGLDKYTIDPEDEDRDRVLLSPDAFAVCEFMEMLIKKIEKTRLSVIK